MESELLSLADGYIPLPTNREARKHVGDTRLSLTERFTGFDDYFSKYQTHIGRLIEDSFVLEQVRPRLEQLAREHRSFFTE